MPPDLRCPLCGELPELIRDDFDCWNVDCQRCGRFEITFEARTNLGNLGPDHRIKLSAYCRRVSGGDQRPIIDYENIEELIALVPNYTPREQLDNLLHVLGKMSPGLGKESQFVLDRDYPLVSTTGGDEIASLMATLRDYGYLRKFSKSVQTTLTLKGWDRLEEIQKAGRQSNRAFVAMWFNPAMNKLYDDAIKPAVLKAGYDPLRIDKHEHVNRIDDEIIGQIRRSRFMVADFTG